MQMTKILNISRYNSKYKIKSQTIVQKDNTSTSLQSKLQSFKNNYYSQMDLLFTKSRNYYNDFFCIFWTVVCRINEC